ncbi:hypothetical protein [Actinoplanes friuliensis]|uniref:hypothetical protein n=1 Tax=Actinoplanes friuliensis TaxID=196914 RepID=UPI0006937FE7|nr:hypothetical protein [Actinoplanes friuliensis]
MAATAASVGMASLVAPTAAQAAPRGPQPVSSGIRAVQAGQDTWVGIRWTTDRRICDVAVRVNGRGVEVDYPGNRRSTSFPRTDSLRPGRTDVTNFRVDADFRRSGIARLSTVIAYDHCGRRDRTIVKRFNLFMPVIVRGGNQGGPGHGHGGPGNGHHNGDGHGHGGPGNGHNNGDGHGHGGPGNGGPGNGGPGNGGPGNGGPGNGGPGNGGPGNGGPGNGGPGNGGPGNGGPGNGGPGNGGPGNGGPGNGGPGNGGPGNGGPGNGGPGNGGPGGPR